MRGGPGNEAGYSPYPMVTTVKPYTITHRAFPNVTIRDIPNDITDLALCILVHNHGQNKGCHCSILKLHVMVIEDLNEVAMSAIFHYVNLARLLCVM